MKVFSDLGLNGKRRCRNLIILQRIYIIRKLRQIVTKEKCGSVCPSSYTKK